MDNWFKSKWFVRLASLAFAVFLYIFVNVTVNSSHSDPTFSGRSEQTQTLDDVPVEIRIDEANYVVSGVPEFVTVSLQGNPGNLTPLIFQRNFDVYVDLQGLEEGDHEVKLEHNISNDLTVFIEPKTIEVTIEERASEEFAVVADFINEDKMAPGYELVNYTLDPPTVTITSSRSVIDQIGIVKAYVNLEGLDSSINNRELPVNVYDTQGNELTVRIEPENIQISAEVDNPSKSVPVSVETTGELPEGYALNSISANVDEVEVFSTSEVLEGISELETEAIDLSEITESGTIDAQLSLPEGVNVPDMETIEVTVDVEQTRVLEGLTIEEEGLASGQAVTFVEPDAAEMDITVTGDDADIKELTAEDIRIFIDLSDLEPGEHQVPITIEGPDADNITITGEFEEATIEISEVEPE
ncbi:CdaR family protein [Oceanobacillus profundus]|uniref:CdaR family protein n=1 Tax=Oceanobacillus profundus TaxID=372463 RepID=UPI00203F732F|nr:CdaR family protein [Oceanobacillus profundus]MCM3400009.1 CdaR family protein [Oceanobacillus profundus]